MLFVGRNRSACHDLKLLIFGVFLRELQWVDPKPTTVSIHIGLGRKVLRHFVWVITLFCCAYGGAMFREMARFDAEYDLKGEPRGRQLLRWCKARYQLF